ncbi:MAG: AraC family transcriptional regulator [Clostridia bacterium]|nr:AraC family transcriptional regulator [Clostridia bacterium]
MSEIQVVQSRAKNQYDLAIYQFGHEKCPATQSFGPFKRDCFLLHFIVAGRGLYRVRGKEFPLSPGDCFLVIPDEDTYYEADPNDPYEFYWIGFRGVNAKSLLEGLGFYENDNFVYHTSEQEYEILHRYMRSMMPIEPCNEVDEKTYTYNLGCLYMILSLLMPRNKMVYGVVAHVEKSIWSEVSEFIAFNYNSPITIESIARKFNFHRTTLYKLFRRYAGTSPREYILNYRLEKALHLVKTTSYSYKSISLECGFSDPTYFYKAFKKKFKRTPQQIRELN